MYAFAWRRSLPFLFADVTVVPSLVVACLVPSSLRTSGEAKSEM